MQWGKRLCSPEWHWAWSTDIKHDSYLPPKSQSVPLRIARPGYFEPVDTQRDKTEMNSGEKKDFRERKTKIGYSKDSLSVWALRNERTRGHKEWDGRKVRKSVMISAHGIAMRLTYHSWELWWLIPVCHLPWWPPNLLVLIDRSVAT